MHMAAVRALAGDPTPITFQVSPLEALLLAGLLQLVVRHPGLPLQSSLLARQTVETIGAQLSTIVPDVAKVLAYGWDPEYDQANKPVFPGRWVRIVPLDES
jgi:hypothetical protein